MPLFFKRRAEPSNTYLPIVLRALQTDRITDQTRLKVAADELLADAKPQQEPAKLVVWRVILVVLLLVGLLLGALNIENEKASQTLLDCFKIAFAAMLTLFGFEVSKST